MSVATVCVWGGTLAVVTTGVFLLTLLSIMSR